MSQNPTSPTPTIGNLQQMIIQVIGIQKLINLYPEGFSVMIKPTLDCLLQGIRDRDDILEHLYEDTCEGLLVRVCHCHSMRMDCADCEDMAHVDSLAIGLLDALLELLLKSDLVLDEMAVFLSPSHFFDYQVRVLDNDSLVLDKRL